MLNKALAKAVIDSGKKKRTIARKARMSPFTFSRIINCHIPATDLQRARIAAALGRSESELFPDAALAAPAESVEATAS